MKFLSLLTLASLWLTTLSVASELTGIWTSEFDSQIGVQKYTYEFKADGDKLTGKATYDHSMGKGETVLTDIKLEHGAVSFVETLSIEGMDIRIRYSGDIAGDQMALKREVGDFATEQIVAKRAQPQAPHAPEPGVK